MIALDRLGRVRLSHLTALDSVTRRGDQIRARVDYPLAARVRAERAQRDQWAEAEEYPRVSRVARPAPGPSRLATIIAHVGTRTW